MVRWNEEALRELEHHLRHELGTLERRGDDLAAQEARRRTKLQTSLGITGNMLAEIAQRRVASAK
jgi:hypothetical protein